MKKMRLLSCLLNLCLFCVSTLAISSYLTENDQTRLKLVLQSGLSSDDLGTLDHAVRGLEQLKVDISNKESICKILKTKLNQNLETLFHIGKITSTIKCSFDLPTNVRETLEAAIISTSSVAELFFASGALHSLGYGLDAPKVLKALNGALKKEDGIISLGQAFHIASLLDGDVTSVFDRIEDAVVQADQVDGKMLQFEGGLSVTAVVVSGAYQLAQVVGKAPPISKDQANKFAEYFVSRKSVQTVKGAHCLLEMVSIFADNPFHIPVAITLANKAVVSKQDPTFQVKISNILGKPIGNLNVVADSATRTLDDAVVLSQKQLTAVSGDQSLYELNLMANEPGKGVYRVALSATAIPPDSRLVGNTGAIVEVKVLCYVAIEEAELGTADSDQSTAPKLKKISYPKKNENVLEADSHQKLILKFFLRDTNSKQFITVHQAFVRLTHKETQQEIFFVAEPDVNDVYKFDLDLAAKGKDFQFLSGKYSMDLIIGDAVIENPTVWNVADLQLSFSTPATSTPKSQTSSMYQVKTEIKHMFREPEKRPPTLVSNTFTILCIVPFFLFLALVAKLGFGIYSFSISPSSLGFHGSLAAIFGLFLCFWLKLNMFQTLKYLALIAPVTFFTGNQLLTQMASKQKSSKH